MDRATSTSIDTSIDTGELEISAACATITNSGSLDVAGHHYASELLAWALEPGKYPLPIREFDDVSYAAPIPMILTCIVCGERHIDEGEFATKPHHTHACQHCGVVWRPAIVPTVGVEFLPGFKNEVQHG